MNKLTSLVRFLGAEKSEVTVSSWDSSTFVYGDREYMVLTDREADKRAKEYILDTVWAFNTDFILDNLNSRFSKVNNDTMEQIVKDCQDRCESGNETLLQFIKKGEFVSEAIRWDGRGHFMSSYDGVEHEQDCYYIYRIN